MTRLAIAALCLIIPAVPAFGVEPATVAESSGYTATSHHAEVLAYCEQLARRAPNVVRLSELGTSHEGRKIPLLILADPPVATPAAAEASGKLVVFIQGNIHAGEVDGKEGVLILAREIALADDRPLLKHLILAIAPNVNPDGNEKFSKNNRRTQNGPPEVGQRGNALGKDLNRDFVKLETPEVRAMVRFYRDWNPAIVIDTHTTNGSYHRYTLTYDGPRNAAISERLVSFVRDTLLPDVGKRLEKKTGFNSFFYGNFSRDRKRWESYPPTPRFGLQYVGMRGRIAILSESYTYAPYKDRVTASREFVRSICEYAADNRDAIRKALNDAKTHNSSVALRQKATPRAKPVNVLGYVQEAGGKPHLDQPFEYTLELWDRMEGTVATKRPFAYLIPAKYSHVIENLQRHGINVEELREDIQLDVTTFEIRNVAKVRPQYLNQTLTSLETGGPVRKKTLVPAGAFLVRGGQTLGTLAAYLLEPLSEDGLAAWGFFEDDLNVGKTYPISRLEAEAPVLTIKARPLAEDRVMGKRIQPEHFLGPLPPPNFNGGAIRGLDWYDDTHYLQVKQGRLQKIEAATGAATPFFDSAKVSAALLKISFDKADANRIAENPILGGGFRGRGGSRVQMNPAKTGILFTQRNDLYFVSFDGKQAVRLTRSPNAKKELARFSPDGNWVAFIHDQNLFAVDLATQKERKLTPDGGGRIFNGKADWVYYEEIFNRDEHAYWWGEDSRSIAFLRIDDTPVPPFSIIDQLPLSPKTEQTHYPKSGQPNPLVKLGIVSVESGTPKFVEMTGYKPDDTLIIRATGVPKTSSFLFYAQNRTQTFMDVMSVDSAGKTSRLFRETTRAWVEDLGEPVFLKDGSFLFTSERDGWKHLYHYAADGNLIRRVTEGPWEMSKLHWVDEKGGWVYFSGMIDSPIGQNLYRVSLTSAGKPERLTDGVGNHSVSCSKACSYFIDTASSFSKPTTVTLRKTSGSIARRLDTNPVYAIEEYKLGKQELVKIPLRDGFVLEGSLLLPVDFDPNRHYPVWFNTYGGPHAPTISDSWRFSTLDHVLSGLGIIVFHCDPRSASGKGAISTWTAYKQLGVQELKDVEEALDWLINRHPYVDASRIGMNGHSYGGFLTSYCLTHSKKFCAGIAGAPVTDWSLYDSIYTERYMLTPKENPGGYSKTSVVNAARNLHGRLLLLHGLMDDNVHVQNSVKLIEELERGGKEFELMFYPRARHGIGGPNYQGHYNKTMLEFIRRTMGK